MQTALRTSVSLGCPGRVSSSRHQPCQPSSSGRVYQPAARAAVAPRAIRNEDAELDRIAKEANQADIWDNEIIGTGLKIALVAGVVAVAVFIGRLGEPMVENTIKSFPTPAEYEAYEESR